ncbi:MAG: rRNA pseudouridine synthase [Actinomycetota bacterium]|nr:rRNA pseudouridine synthase [Actinomycetota bacterium]
MEPERVQRSLARAGYGSRRACEELVRGGRVRINGEPATLGDRVDPETDVVEVDGGRVVTDPNSRTFALHKPAGVVSSLSDPQGRPDLRGFLPEDTRVVPVGRLDLETEGLLLLTGDGELANRLMHPRYGVEKEYLAEVEGTPTGKQVASLRHGVELEDGPARPRSIRVVDGAGTRAALRIVMVEGRNREIRRMLAAVGLPVRRLVRVRVGSVRLGTLPAGELREITGEELSGLYEAPGR